MSKGKKNAYTCKECGRSIVTLDIDEGTTPFMIMCRKTKGCQGFSYSSFYSVDQTLPVDYVWFMPTDLSGYDDAMLEHIRKGGLDIREATQTERWTKI